MPDLEQDIRLMLKKGYDRDFIRDYLIQNRYSPADIDSALNNTYTKNDSAMDIKQSTIDTRSMDNSHHDSPLSIVRIIVIIICIIIASAVVFFIMDSKNTEKNDFTMRTVIAKDQTASEDGSIQFNIYLRQNNGCVFELQYDILDGPDNLKTKTITKDIPRDIATKVSGELELDGIMHGEYTLSVTAACGETVKTNTLGFIVEQKQETADESKTDPVNISDIEPKNQTAEEDINQTASENITQKDGTTQQGQQSTYPDPEETAYDEEQGYNKSFINDIPVYEIAELYDDAPEQAIGMCHHNSDSDRCLRELAEKVSEPDICSGINKTISRDSCFANLADTDISLCEQIEDSYTKAGCIAINR